LVGWALSRVTADEGGLRFDGPFRLWRRYRAFSEISRLDVSAGQVRAFGEKGELLESWGLANYATLATVYAMLSDRVDQHRSRSENSDDMFARGGRGLRQWLNVIADTVRRSEASGAYRTAGIDLDRAATVVADPNASIEARAGAAHALLSSRERRYRVAAANALGEDSPPLVVAAAALAEGGKEWEARAKRVLAYLPKSDRHDWREMSAANGRARATQ
jgi:hypothetical protein